MFKTDTTVDQLLEILKFRQEDMNPLDRQSKFGKVRLILGNPDDTMVDGRVNEQFAPEWALTSPGVSAFPDVVTLSNHALAQLCSKKNLHYPKELMERLPVPNVFADVNDLLANHMGDKDGYFRMVHSDGVRAELRAVMGGRFTPLDDLEILEAVADILNDAGGVVRYHGISNLSSHFTVTFPDLTRDSDGLEPGIHLGNSETGVRSLTVQSVLFRQICTNVLPRIDMAGDFGRGANGNLYVRDTDDAHDMTGARKGVVESGWRFVHMGDRNKLREFVKNAVEEAVQTDNPMLKAWDEGLSVKIDDPVKAMGRIARLSKLTKDDTTMAQSALLGEAAVSGTDFTNTVTGLANGFTRAGNHDDITNEKRYQFQIAGANAFKHLLN